MTKIQYMIKRYRLNSLEKIIQIFTTCRHPLAAINKNMQYAWTPLLYNKDKYLL